MSVIDQTMTAEDFMKRATAKAEEGDYVGAVQSYDRVIELNPDYARAYGNRGFVKKNLGDRLGALADFQMAAKLFLAQGKTANYEQVLDYLRKF
jgi:Flp pilus assembly protein TadD